MSKLTEIQAKLKAPKSQYNNFGKYHYRSCEDILEAVKPLLGDATLVVSDSIVEIGGRVYVCAKADLTCGDMSFSAFGYAREPENKKGMDESQITGAASSYARKYALNGLFLIDDTKDADHTNRGTAQATKPAATKPSSSALEPINEAQLKLLNTEISKRQIDREKFKGYLKLQSLKQVTKKEFEKVLNTVKQKPLKEGVAENA